MGSLLPGLAGALGASRISWYEIPPPGNPFRRSITNTKAPQVFQLFFQDHPRVDRALASVMTLYLLETRFASISLANLAGIAKLASDAG